MEPWKTFMAPLFGDVAGLGAVVEGVRLVEEPGAGRDGGHGVDPACVAGRDHQQRTRHHGPRVEDHLHRDHLRAGDRAQHRHVGVAVVLAVAHRQRPVVRRGPEEDHHEQHDGGPLDGVGDGGPGDQDRETPGGAAPDDVLGRAPLEDHGVDDHVEDDGAEPQPGGERVGPEPEDGDRRRAQQPGEDERFARGDLAGDQRPVLGAVHEFVDVAVDVTVEGPAEPAANAPPTSVARISPIDGNPRSA